MADLGSFFNPRSVAIVGASSDGASISGRPLRLLIQHGFDGGVYPINPRHEELYGRQVYRTIGDVPAPVDLAVVVVPARVVPSVLEECAAASVRHAMVISSGFAESPDADGPALQGEIRELVGRTSMRVSGPN